MGGVSGGHYIAFARQHVTNKWYKFDDKDVEEVSEDTVKKQEAYVLFYRRKHDLKQYDNIHTLHYYMYNEGSLRAVAPFLNKEYNLFS
jgi:hypothetical protein